MEAIILAGGKGTRLQSIIKDVPKPMAPINGKPFLYYLLKKLQNSGIKKIILSVGYKYKTIIEYFDDSFYGIPIVYSIEEELLGTGGAIAKSLHFCNEEDVFVINGDTYLDLNYIDMYNFHKEKKSKLTLCLKEMKNYSRYGTVIVDEKNKVIGFEEKKFKEVGFINAGVYCLNKELIDKFKLNTKFSFENDFLEKKFQDIPIFAYICNAYFIDIGIPEDYYSALKDFLVIEF